VGRHMLWDPSRPLSVHSWGAALDFDAHWNGYGSQGDINPAFVRIMEEHGFVWGGRWDPSHRDAMHFQWTKPLPNTVVPPWQDTAATEKGL